MFLYLNNSNYTRHFRKPKIGFQNISWIWMWIWLRIGIFSLSWLFLQMEFTSPHGCFSTILMGSFMVRQTFLNPIDFWNISAEKLKISIIYWEMETQIKVGDNLGCNEIQWNHLCNVDSKRNSIVMFYCSSKNAVSSQAKLSIIWQTNFLLLAS